MRIFLSFVALLNFGIAVAQHESDVVSGEWSTSPAGAQVLNYVNKDYCPYTLCMNNGCRYRLSPGPNTVVSISKNSGDVMQSRDYRYFYFKGAVLSKINLNTLYALPIRSGESTQINIVPGQMRTYAFLVASRDTVFAMRGGLVCREEPKGYSYPHSALSSGSVLVCHSDGTFAEYRGFSERFVSPGQTLKVGQPIGLAPVDTGYPKQLFTVCCFFLDENKLTSSMAEQSAPHTSFAPKIHTANLGDVKPEESKEYQAVLDNTLITQEMSSRELKRYQKHR